MNKLLPVLLFFPTLALAQSVPIGVQVGFNNTVPASAGSASITPGTTPIINGIANAVLYEKPNHTVGEFWSYDSVTDKLNANLGGIVQWGTPDGNCFTGAKLYFDPTNFDGLAVADGGCGDGIGMYLSDDGAGNTNGTDYTAGGIYQMRSGTAPAFDFAVWPVGSLLLKSDASVTLDALAGSASIISRDAGVLIAAGDAPVAGKALQFFTNNVQRLIINDTTTESASTFFVVDGLLRLGSSPTTINDASGAILPGAIAGVHYGAADSCGTGFKCIGVPN